MTVLDTRLLPLLETLVGAAADWLAFEIVDGVRRGREPLEPEELLRAAREKVRSRRLSDRLSAEIPVLSEPILGDDQIVWAAIRLRVQDYTPFTQMPGGYSSGASLTMVQKR